MKEFDFGSLRAYAEAVGEEQGLTVWEVGMQSSGGQFQALVFSEGPEEAVVHEMVKQLRSVHRHGVKEYTDARVRSDPRIDEADERKRVATMFQVADAADPRDLERAEKQLFEEAQTPESREAARVLSRTWDFGDVRVSIRPHSMVGPGIAAFYVLMEGPNFKDEDLMQRPAGYLVSRVGSEHIQVIRRVVKEGIPWAVAHHMKMNYLGEEMRTHVERYIANLHRVGTILGDDRLATMQAAFEGEMDKEEEERGQLAERFAERERAEEIAALEERLRVVDEEIARLRAKRGKK